MSEYRICKRCIMDTTSDPNLILDENGVCNYCHAYDEEVKRVKQRTNGGEKKLKEVFDRIKKECKNKEYDCLLGLSGGVDSSYVAYLAKKHGLRVLAVHVDTGWNSELAVQNIENICKKLGYDLHTFVVDWPTMKELQRAYMFSGLANLDVPQDHSYLAATEQLRRKYHIKYVLNGCNYATEGILSKAFQYTYRDWENMKGVYKKCGRGKSIRKIPHLNFWDFYMRMPYLSRAQVISPLNYINYSKKMAIEVLEREFGWKYYGGKHYESRFTKFFQEIYLPQRYGWEKRRDHIASLIVGGEMSREEGLKEIAIPTSTESELEEEKKYILKKLDITEDEWKGIMMMPYKTEDDYPNMKRLVKFFSSIKHIFVGKQGNI